MDETELAVKDVEIRQNHALTIYQSKIELTKMVSNIGLFFVKSLILINSGAVVALLGLLGGLNGPPGLAAKLANPTLAFVAGIVAGMGCIAAAFFAQQFHNNEKGLWGHVSSAVCYLFGSMGLVMFAWGAFEAVGAIAMHNS